MQLIDNNKVEAINKKFNILQKGGEIMTEPLQGKKTYILAGLTALYGILGAALGHLEVAYAVEVIIGALAMTTIRLGIAKK